MVDWQCLLLLRCPHISKSALTEDKGTKKEILKTLFKGNRNRFIRRTHCVCTSEYKLELKREHKNEKYIYLTKGEKKILPKNVCWIGKNEMHLTLHLLICFSNLEQRPDYEH